VCRLRQNLTQQKNHTHSAEESHKYDSNQGWYQDLLQDWGKGPAATFSHGWLLNSDAWDGKMLFLVRHGYGCVAVGRRGQGRSSQPSIRNDMDGCADDLGAVMEALDLKNATLVGHSTGGGEVARYVRRHGSKRVAAAALIGLLPPIEAQAHH